MAKILVIDDEVSVYMSVKLTLEKHEVIFGCGGRNGLERFKKERPGLVFLDLKMPDINGIDVLRIIRKTNREVPVIILTAYAGDAFELYKDELKIASLMIKPFDVDELRDEVDKILGEGESEKH